MRLHVAVQSVPNWTILVRFLVLKCITYKRTLPW